MQRPQFIYAAKAPHDTSWVRQHRTFLRTEIPNGSQMLSATDALQRLSEGNQRFIREAADDACVSISAPTADHSRKHPPFAVVVGCSDPRVPPEAVFAQGVGDLFTVRVAGNVASRSVVETVGFAVDRFRIPLVVVLGHSQCVAVESTLDDLLSGGEAISPLPSIQDRIRAAIERVVPSDETRSAALLARAVRANVAHVAEELRETLGSHDVAVVGAEYSIDTRAVEFFDGIDGIAPGGR